MQQSTTAITGALSLFVALILLKVLLRKLWVCGAAFVVVFSFQSAAGAFASGVPWTLLGVYAVIYSLLVIVMLRLGIFALMVTIFTVNSLTALPFTALAGKPVLTQA